MMGLPGEIFVPYEIPDTKEGIVERIEELERHTPANWLGALARQCEIDACKKRLGELNEAS